MSDRLKQDISIGNNLREVRVKNGLSQELLVRQLGAIGVKTSREIISQMERGVCNIKISYLLGLHTLFGISFDAFFKGVSLPTNQ